MDSSELKKEVISYNIKNCLWVICILNLTLKMNKKAIFANLIIGSAIIFFLTVFIFSLYKSSESPSVRMILYYIGSCIVIILFAYALRCKTDFKINVALLLLSVVMIAYAIELFLSFDLLVFAKHNTDDNLQKRIKFAEAQGIPFDTRSLFQVVLDLRSKGTDAYPVSRPHNYIYSDGLSNREVKVYPLGSISGKTVVLCNENGEFIIDKNDEHGFNNPEGLYSGDSTDIVLLGDSFVHGHCVKSEKNIAGWLRRSGEKVLNLGMGANGPLIELAILQEYAKPLKPKVVFWFYYEGNDQVDLEEEKKASLLMKYMDRKYSQGLINNQGLIDKLVIEYVEQKISSTKRKDELSDKSAEQDYSLSFTEIARLSQLYNRFKIIKECFFSVDPLFKNILAEAKGRVNAWGGQLYFVYLPAIDRYLNESNRCSNFSFSKHKTMILSIAKDLEIPVIDIHESLTSNHDLYSLFPFRLNFRGHFNEEGYKFVAEQLITKLHTDENQ